MFDVISHDATAGEGYSIDPHEYKHWCGLRWL